jgi:hypothetical protein
MPDYRTHTLVADRGDVDFHKRPDPLRKNRKKWIVLCGILGLWPLIWQAAGRNDQTIYWAHTLSDSHQIVQDNCQKCHLKRFQTFRMNFMTPDEIRVIEANTCQTCHWEDTRDHNASMVSQEAQGCFDCHAEHRHKSSLSLVADVYCTECHEDLRIESGKEILSSPNFITAISSFEDHPEFQIRRAVTAESQSRQADQTGHKAFLLAKPPEPSEEGLFTNWDWTDKAHFKFNHQLHLAEAGVAIPEDHSSNRGLATPQKTLILSCSNCHEQDEQGEYFRPIHYERHCAECHELSFVKELSEVGLPRSNPTPLPHEKPEIIRGTLRERLTAYINNHPDQLDANAEDALLTNPLPHVDYSIFDPTVREAAEWVEDHLAEIEGVVRGTGANLREVKNGCVKCHETKSLTNPQGVNWEVLPPNIPDRWLPHSRFRHDRHDMLECYDCHHLRPPEDTDRSNDRRDPHSIFQSNKAEHILMPSIETCRSCHGSPVQTPLLGRVKARDGCTECHNYHHTLDMSAETREDWDQFDGISDVENRLWRQRKVPISREQLLRNLPTK